MMPGRRVAIPIVAALFAGLVLAPAFAAEPKATSNDRPDEFIVTAKAIEDLRIKIRLAEDEVYARFNDINSDDGHDIHCYDLSSPGTHVQKRRCVSNAWRELAAAGADATIRGLQSLSTGTTPDGSPQASVAGGSGAGAYQANQLHTERLIIDEIRQLADTDPILNDALARTGQAYQELAAATGERHPEWTLYRDLGTGGEGAPVGAKRLYEVRVGEVAWNHPLTARTFTIDNVNGRVRDMIVRCGRLDSKLKYREQIEWTIPDSWGSCNLVVGAKRGTTFAFYEF
jgi:hypothetical protein